MGVDFHFRIRPSLCDAQAQFILEDPPSNQLKWLIKRCQIKDTLLAEVFHLVASIS